MRFRLRVPGGWVSVIVPRLCWSFSPVTPFVPYRFGKRETVAGWSMALGVLLVVWTRATAAGECLWPVR